MPQRVRASQATSSSAAPKKLQMTVTYDKINADLLIRFDRKPEGKDEWDLLNAMKTNYNFAWSGYAETGKWKSDKHAVSAFEEKSFRARIKLACTGLSFFSPTGDELSLTDFVEAVKNFDPDAVDDDLSSLSKSSVPPNTPGKRPRA